MSGLLMLGLLITWISVSVMLSRWLGRRFRHLTARTAVALVSFVVLLLLPVADELIGMRQFDALCKRGATLTIDAERIKGKTVRVVVDPSWARAESTAIPISYSRYSYRDVTTNNELASYTLYNAKGGWLVHVFGIFEGNEPLILNRSGCSFPGEGHISRTYQFTLIN